MKYSVCIDSVFQGIDFIEALKICHGLKMDGIEFWSWWDKDLDRIAAFIQEHGMTVATFCTKFISLTDPACREEYIEALKEGIAAAKKLGCKSLISQTGSDTGAPREEQRASLIEGLKCCAPLLEESGITLLVEPLNTKVDHIGYFTNSSDEVAGIIKEMNSPCVKMLFDIYHQQISEGDILRHMKEHLPLIAHVHTAGNPGRNELYRSEINYAYILKELENMGYDGYIGLEYFALDEQEQGLLYARDL